MATGGSFKDSLLWNKYGHIVKSSGRDVMAHTLEIILQEESLGLTLAERLTNLGIYSKIAKKNQGIIDRNEPLQERDITFIYDIILKFYQVKTGLPHEDLKKLLKEIKGERNTVSHEEKELTPLEFDGKLRDFHVLLEKTIDEVCKLYPSHRGKLDALSVSVNDNFNETKKGVRERLDPKQDLKIFKKEQEDFIPQLEQNIKEECRDQLRPQLLKCCKTVPFGWISKYKAIDPSTISLPTQVQKEKEVSRMSSENSVVVDSNKIFEIKGERDEDVNVVIISAEAGGGKTTLLRLIAEKWSKEETHAFPGLNKHYLLFYVEFRNGLFKSLDDFIGKTLQPVVSRYTFAGVKTAISHSNCVFLLDGYDERNKSSSLLFKDILEFNTYQTKIVVTTRPVNTTDVIGFVNDCQNTRVNLRLLGIPKKSCLETIPKLVDLHCREKNQRAETVRKVTDAVDSMHPELRHLLEVPLYNTMIIILLINYPLLRDSVNTVSSLFLEMKKHKLKRLLKEKGMRDKEADIQKFEDFYNLRALRNHLQQKYELTKEDLRDFKDECDKLDLPFQDVMSSFFNTKFSVDPLGTEQTFCYEHRTDQEFSAALAICKMLANEGGQYDDIHKGSKQNILHEFVCREAHQVKGKAKESNLWKDLQNILPFVTGILCKRNLIDQFAQQVIELVHLERDEGEYVNMNYYLQLLSESENDESISIAFTKKSQKEEIKNWAVTKYLSSLPHLLSKVDPQSISLKVEGNTMTSLCYLESLNIKMGVRMVKNLFHHDSFRRTDYSDDAVEAANPIPKNFRRFLDPWGMKAITETIPKIFTEVNRNTFPVSAKGFLKYKAWNF